MNDAKLKEWLEEVENYHREEMEKLTDVEYDYHYHNGQAEAYWEVQKMIKKEEKGEDK